MSLDRIDRIRYKEKQYHDDCYENVALFQSGSWLQKPVKTVLELFDERFDPKDDLRLLDLGCGVGRNSIPLAQRMQNPSGKIVCVDLLESAIRNLEKYGRKYGVIDHLETVIADIGAFRILPDSYDFLFSVSVLEHLESKAIFETVLANLIQGTRERGVHCWILNANVKERIVETGEEIEPMFEILFDTEELLSFLSTIYKDWRVLKQTVKPYEIEISRDDKRVSLSSDVVTWAVQKNRNSDCK